MTTPSSRQAPFRSLILPLLALLAGLMLVYWTSWEFYYRRIPVPADPFAPQSTADRCLAFVYGPAEVIDRAVRKWRARQAAYDAIQGSWTGLVWHGHDVVDLMVVIQRDTLTFSEAKGWPDLHEREFTIEESEDHPEEFYIVTKLGRLNVKPVNETAKGGVAPEIQIWQPILGGVLEKLFESPYGNQFHSGARLDAVPD